MILLRKNRLNSVISTAQQNAELTNPVFLFSFENIFTKEVKNFIPLRQSTNLRFDEFEFFIGTNENLTGSTPTVNFTDEGQYTYSVYEQTSTTNTNPVNSYRKVEEGRASLINPDQTDPFDIYVSPNENNANFVYYTDIEQTTDVKLNLRFFTQFQTQSSNQSWYNEGRLPLPYYISDTGNTFNTERLFTKWVERRNGTPGDLLYSLYDDIELDISGGSQTLVVYLDSGSTTGTQFQIDPVNFWTKFELFDFVVYADANAMTTAEPSLDYSALPTGNTCGRYVVYSTSRYRPNGTLFNTIRGYQQEIGGGDCNTGVSPLVPYWSIPTTWYGNDIDVPSGAILTAILRNSAMLSQNFFGGLDYGQIPTPTPTPTPVVYDTDYQLILNAATSANLEQPSYLEKLKQNQLVLDLKNAGIWSQLNGFWMFKLDETGAPDSREFTLINWIQPTTFKVQFVIFKGDLIEWNNNLGWYIPSTSKLQFGTNVNQGPVPLLPNSSGNTCGGYWDSIGGNGYIWITTNNAWNRVYHDNTSLHSVWRNNTLTSSYDFTGAGFKTVHTTGSPVTDLTLLFRNQGVDTLVTKVALDVGVAGNAMCLGAPEFNNLNGAEQIAQMWFSARFLNYNDLLTLESIINTYMTS